MGQVTAAPREFNPGYDRLGSFSTEAAEAARPVIFRLVPKSGREFTDRGMSQMGQDLP